MIYNRLYRNIIIRVTLILITSLGLAFSIYKMHDWLLIANLCFLLLLQAYLLIRAVNKTNTNLEAFFASLDNNDASISLHIPKHNRSYKQLMERLNKVRHTFNTLRLENEKQFHYFKAVVEHIGVGMILCNENGNVEMVNSAGKKILNIGAIRNLDQLNIYNDTLSVSLLNLNPGMQKMFRLFISGKMQPISFKVNDYRFFDKTTRIISYQNIKNELDAQELESWQKLIRVLTHEIMNSTGPIISSIDTIREFLTDEQTKEAKQLSKLNQETIADVLSGIDIIKERSIGLSEFVSTFRSLTISPQIKLQKFKVEALFVHIRFLLSDKLKGNNIQLETIVSPANLEIMADQKLIEQVILNLLYNAVDALEFTPDKQIRLIALRDLNSQPVIQVIDNGKGISEELMDKIFIPFFTTKENGSGIGLSISSQIMQLHGGTISARSGKETCFEICFAS